MRRGRIKFCILLERSMFYYSFFVERASVRNVRKYSVVIKVCNIAVISLFLTQMCAVAAVA